MSIDSATDPPRVTKKGLDIINHVFPHDTFAILNLRTQLTHNEFFVSGIQWVGEVVLEPESGIVRYYDDDD